jgi:prevent-host-death family protein
MATAAATKISAADANRNFSELLRHVREGRTVVVTVHGRAAAKVIPFDSEQDQIDDKREGLLARLSSQKVITTGRWTRESLYRE